MGNTSNATDDRKSWLQFACATQSWNICQYQILIRAWYTFVHAPWVWWRGHVHYFTRFETSRKVPYVVVFQISTRCRFQKGATYLTFLCQFAFLNYKWSTNWLSYVSLDTEMTINGKSPNCFFFWVILFSSLKIWQYLVLIILCILAFNSFCLEFNAISMLDNQVSALFLV